MGKKNLWYFPEEPQKPGKDAITFCPTTGKTKYESEEDAENGLERMKKKVPNYDGEPYYCLYCENYHFGKRKNKKKQS